MTGTRELTAADYVYQIKRVASPYLHSPIAGVMREYIVGFDAFRKQVGERYKDSAKGVWQDLRDIDFAGLSVDDRYTYRIRIHGEYPQLVYWLAMPFFAPMPWEAEKFYSQPGMEERNIALNWYPVGTGPFMLTENNPNLRMVMEKNPNFHGELYPSYGEPQDRGKGLLDDAGKALPLVHKAVFSLEKENIPYWSKFLQGYYDASGVSSDSFDQAIQFGSQGDVQLTELMQAKDIQLETSVTASILYMGFNMLNPVVGGDSARARVLRRAISIAVDYEEYISIFANGRGIPAQGPVPPGIFGNIEGEAGINPYVYDWVDGEPKKKGIEEARQLMARAGYVGGIDQASGKPLVLYFDTPGAGPGAKAHFNWMRKQYQKLGIQLVIRATDYNRFQEKMRKGTGQIFQWGWNADYPDPENFFFLLYGPNAKVKHSGENTANYQNPEFDRLFEQMKNIENGPERLEIIRQMTWILQRDAPWLWGHHPKAFSLFHDWYKNVKPNLMANNLLKYKRVDGELRDMKRAEWNRPNYWPLVILSVLLLVSFIPAVIGFYRREHGTLEMISYIIRRALYAIPILVGVNIITFLLFFVVNTPDDMARMFLGQKHVTEAQVEDWKTERGYHHPLFYNAEKQGMDSFKETIFYTKSLRLFVFDFGRSDSGRDISFDISQRMWPSLAIAVPQLLIGLLLAITFALLIAFFRATYIDYWAVVICVALMSISSLFYIIGGQFVMGKLLRVVPISGFESGIFGG